MKKSLLLFCFLSLNCLAMLRPTLLKKSSPLKQHRTIYCSSYPRDLPLHQKYINSLKREQILLVEKKILNLVDIGLHSISAPTLTTITLVELHNSNIPLVHGGLATISAYALYMHIKKRKDLLKAIEQTTRELDSEKLD